jgi:hypothetical protein
MLCERPRVRWRKWMTRWGLEPYTVGRIVSPRRGNHETVGGQTLNAVQTALGRCTREASPANRRAAEDRWGVRSAHTTRRWLRRSHGAGADRDTPPAAETWPRQGGPERQWQPHGKETRSGPQANQRIGGATSMGGSMRHSTGRAGATVGRTPPRAWTT